MIQSRFSPAAYASLAAALRQAPRIVITTHRRPDGDAMGSSLGLGLALRAAGHDVQVIPPTPYDHYLSWLPGMEMVTTASLQPDAAHAAIAAADMIFCLDFCALSRIDELSGPVSANPCPKVLIDHHIGPEDFAQHMFHIVGASSTAELVWHVLRGLNLPVTADIAANLYTGLMTDTGSFRFSSTTPDVHRVAAELLETGIDVGRIHNLIFDNFSEGRTRFLGYLLHEKLHVLREYRTAYMTISLEDKRRFNITDGDTEGFVNYNLSLGGINFGVLLIEDTTKTKISFRSIGSFPCNEFAGNFSGGGHHNASGGQYPGKLEEAEARFLELLPQYLDQLTYTR